MDFNEQLKKEIERLMDSNVCDVVLRTIKDTIIIF